MGKSRQPRNSPDVRRFLRACGHRMEEAAFLLDPGGFGTAATYLAGYAIECALKALILFSEPVARQRATLRSFRGVRAHDFDWLKEQLALRKCFTPTEVANQLANVAWWDTD